MHNLAKMKKTIDTYISELLFLHDCVIIPEFGGFVGNNKSAVLNKNTNTIYPPSKKILFNKNLRTNDGLLINHISNSEVISNEKSKEFVVKNALEKIKNSDIKELVLTDSIQISESVKKIKNIRHISIAPLMGEAIKRIHSDSSVSALFNL